MYLISANAGHAEPLPGVKTIGQTGIYKRQVSGPVQVTSLGLGGDVVCDTENHGGVDQAIYVYGAIDYAWWSATLGYELEPGTFGENLTVAGLASADFSIGDRLNIGSVSLQITSPRIPCVTLAARMGDPAFVKRFRYAERPGLYCRVLREGVVRAGDSVTVERYDRDTIGVIEMFRDWYLPQLPEPAIRRQLAAPIAIRARAELEDQLRKLSSDRNEVRPVT
jgi:MOSC domain-containing protein YiiM